MKVPSISLLKERFTRDRMKRWLRKFWKEWRLTLIVIVFVIIPLKSALADWNWVPTGSMNPTILEGDLIFVNKAAYDLRFPLTMWRLAWWGDPQRGDIIVCFSPEDETRLVKRVVGLPGDTMAMLGNHLVINGHAIEYTNLDSDSRESLPERFKHGFRVAMEQLGEHKHAVMGHPAVVAQRDIAPFVVPEGKYFVMGDNRDMSRDSRVFGFVDRKLIIGRAKGVIISFDKTDKYQPRFDRFFSSLK